MESILQARFWWGIMLIYLSCVCYCAYSGVGALPGYILLRYVHMEFNGNIVVNSKMNQQSKTSYLQNLLLNIWCVTLLHNADVVACSLWYV